MVFLRRTTSRCPRPTKVDVATDCGTQPWWPGPAKGCQGWGRMSHAACRRCEKPPPKWAHTLCNAHASERSDTAAESNHDKVTEPCQSPSQRAKGRCADLSAEHSDDDTNSPTSDCEGDAGERAAVAADAGVGDGSNDPALKSRIAVVRTALEAVSEAGLVAMLRQEIGRLEALRLPWPRRRQPARMRRSRPSRGWRMPRRREPPLNSSWLRRHVTLRKQGGGRGSPVNDTSGFRTNFGWPSPRRRSGCNKSAHDPPFSRHERSQKRRSGWLRPRWRSVYCRGRTSRQGCNSEGQRLMSRCGRPPWRSRPLPRNTMPNGRSVCRLRWLGRERTRRPAQKPLMAATQFATLLWQLQVDQGVCEHAPTSKRRRKEQVRSLARRPMETRWKGSRAGQRLRVHVKGGQIPSLHTANVTAWSSAGAIVSNRMVTQAAALQEHRLVEDR